MKLVERASVTEQYQVEGVEEVGQGSSIFRAGNSLKLTAMPESGKSIERSRGAGHGIRMCAAG